jgi:hypothetical protein
MGKWQMTCDFQLIVLSFNLKIGSRQLAITKGVAHGGQPPPRRMKIRRLKSSPADIAARRPPARTLAFACGGRRPANGSHAAISIAGIFEGVAHGGQPPPRRMKIRRLKSSPADIAARRPPARTLAFACGGRRPANGSHAAISIAGIFEGGRYAPSVRP